MRPLEDFVRDLRLGIRLFARSPIFSLVAILSLAIGIGANTAIFTLINAIVLRELPVPEASRLFIATLVPTDSERFSYPAFEQARDQLAGRAQMSAMSNNVRMLLVPRAASATPSPENSYGQLVSGEWFDVLRQHAQIGRLLTQDDNRHLGAHPIAVISDGYWSRRYGRSPAALTASALRAMLFGIRFTDIATHVTAAGVLILVAVLAAYLPARRASRVDPMLALRAD